MLLFKLWDDTKNICLLLSQDEMSKEEGMMQKIWVKLLNNFLYCFKLIHIMYQHIHKKYNLIFELFIIII